MNSVICASIRRSCLLPGKRQWKSRSSTNRLLMKNNPLQRRTMMPYNRRNYNKTHSIALSGLLFALAMALSFIEGTLVIPGLLPGMKLGPGEYCGDVCPVLHGAKTGPCAGCAEGVLRLSGLPLDAGFLSLCGGLLFTAGDVAALLSLPAAAYLVHPVVCRRASHNIGYCWEPVSFFPQPCPFTMHRLCWCWAL